MIYGIGIDLVENERMERILQKWGDKFLSRVFSPGEIEYCGRQALTAMHYSARFAAKESFLKAIGKGLGAGVKLQEIEVAHEESGRPLLVLSGGAGEFLKNEGVENIHLSISHTKKYAIAMALLEK